MPSEDSPTTPLRGSTAPVEDQEQLTTLSLRRAPRVSVFLSTGAAIGLIAGIVIGVLGSGNVEFTTTQVIGYMAVIFALLGVALGAVAYVVADRISVRRAREVQAHLESRTAAPNDRPADVGD
ncbi:hypothetical protein [Kocuria palustris]|uniref:hypothetical protein n=1 Tax=Kocuria palustris TaxID=71999 RepID=UPI003D728C1C